MQAALYKCCFCLQTVVKPIVMCQQTHVACFECVCQHLRKTEESKCPMCRDSMRLRFDRLILESANYFPRSKRRKTAHTAYDVFQQILALKQKEKFKPFTRIMKRFALATDSEISLEQMAEDVENIRKANESIKRLTSQRLYDHSLRITNI